jgi:protein-S-isoprenylcysteine O-methyltransferase Ste14
MTIGREARRRAAALLLTLCGWSAMWAAALALVPHALGWLGVLAFFGGLALVPWSFRVSPAGETVAKKARGFLRLPAAGESST